MLPGSVVFAYHLQAGNAALHGVVLYVDWKLHVISLLLKCSFICIFVLHLPLYIESFSCREIPTKT